MQLTNLHVQLVDYGELKGQYTGKVYFKNGYGGIEVALDPELSRRVLAICSEMLVKQAQATANLIATEVLESAEPKALEG